MKKMFIFGTILAVTMAGSMNAMNQTEEPRYFYWLEKGKIAGMACPEKQSDLDWIKEQDFGLIVTLTEKTLGEMGFDTHNLEVLHLPVRDASIPSKEQVDRFIARAREVIDQGQTVVVHCENGCGRTGIFLACWLGTFLQSTSAQEMKKELVLRRKDGLYKDQQINFVQKYLNNDF